MAPACRSVGLHHGRQAPIRAAVLGMKKTVFLDFIYTMARIKLDVPKQFHFKTEIDVRVSDINYGNHMGNDALLSILHEARIRFLANYECKELDLFGVSLIMSDVAIQYKNEAYHGDVLQIELTAYDFGVTSFDLFYYVTRKSDQKIIAMAKTHMVCYNYNEKKMKEVPEKFLNFFVSST